MVKRPNQIPQRQPLTSVEIAQAKYVGSAEHKSQAWWGGLPRAYVKKDGTASRPKKQKTTICPLVSNADRERATEWVRQALKGGSVRFYEGDKDFPKHIWYEDSNGQYWFGFCVNGVSGEYKGWPIEREEKDEVFS